MNTMPLKTLNTLLRVVVEHGYPLERALQEIGLDYNPLQHPQPGSTQVSTGAYSQLYRLLMQIEHNPELIAFQEETLGPLLAYEGGAELIRTLEAYFQHNSVLSQTAEALFIHRNTLLYRMERIGEILKLDLDKPASRLAVQLALHIHRMTGGASSS